MKSNILVLGGAGFIGSHTFVALIEQGYSAAIVDDFSNAEISAIQGIEKIIKKKVKLYKGDSKDAAFMARVFKAEKKIDGVIHFAAHKYVSESVKDPLKYYDNNLNSLIVLLRLMNEYGGERAHGRAPLLVYSSSCTVYGQPDKLPVTEETPLKEAECPYGNTKKICEEIMRDTVHSGSPLKVIALRYFNPVGAHESGAIGELPRGVPENLVPFVTQTAAGWRKSLTVFGNDYDTPDGSCVRDYIHVMDLADAHIAALEYLRKQKAPYYDVFNAGVGHGNSVMELIKTFEDVNGLKLNYSIGPRREGDIIKIYADVRKINTKLGWKAKRSLKDALRDAWRWQKTLGKKAC